MRIYQFNLLQRLGIISLIVLIAFLQTIYFLVDFSEEEIYDTTRYQHLLKITDSLRQQALSQRKDTVYPFNPNYLTDYKGYTIGLTPEQIDRLLSYRKAGKFVNSAKEFQQVTHISDSLLAVLSPLFRFPEWVVNQKKETFVSSSEKGNQPLTSVEKKDINTATKEDLMKIRGIGQVLSERILEHRTRLQGFTYMEQLETIHGLDSGLRFLISERFEVITIPNIQKQNINTINLYKLSQIPFLNYNIAKQIIMLRSNVGNITSFEQLSEIKDLDDKKRLWIQSYLHID